MPVAPASAEFSAEDISAKNMIHVDLVEHPDPINEFGLAVEFLHVFH